MSRYFIKIIHILIFYSIISVPLQAASTSPSVICASQLQSYLQSILKIPEAKVLLESIAKEGPIRIVTGNHAVSRQFGAFWDPDRRIICIHLPSHAPQQEIIGSLLFELHNAAANSKIHQLNQLASQRKINKERYIESMEYLEYMNSKKASQIAVKGVKMGALPQGSDLPTYSNFQEHFKAQKQSGHSACFAHNYDLCLKQSLHP